jgi:hypothetical protein
MATIAVHAEQCLDLAEAHGVTRIRIAAVARNTAGWSYIWLDTSNDRNEHERSHNPPTVRCATQFSYVSVG